MQVKSLNWIVSILKQPIVFVLLAVLMTGCASSDVSREAEHQVDAGFSNGRNTFGGDYSLSESYQNASQTSKGVVIGGVAGALTGWMTSGVGVFPGLASGAILGGALGAYIDAHTTLVDKLENRNVKVIVLGDQVLIVLYSDSLFDGMTGHLKSSSYSTLNLVAELIGHYTNMMVTVAGYTNDMGPKNIDIEISRAQARSVAKYLWRRGVNTRMLYAEGYGGSKLVSPNATDWNLGENYRIEITLEKLPV